MCAYERETERQREREREREQRESEKDVVMGRNIVVNFRHGIATKQCMQLEYEFIHRVRRQDIKPCEKVLFE